MPAYVRGFEVEETYFMVKKSAKTPSVLQRAIGVMQGRKLYPFKGTDITEIERKVTEYYASQTGRDYYARLATQDLWTDAIHRKNFETLCQSACDIMDFGCGAGGLAVALAQNFPEKKIHAIDLGAHAGQLIAQSNSDIDFRSGSVLKAPCADNVMDLIICRFVIEHVIYPHKLLSEAFRILKPKGVLYLLYPQLLLKVRIGAAISELFSCIFNPDKLTYLDPQIGQATADADDQDAVWLTNPFRMTRLLKSVGFESLKHVPLQSLVIARKS